MRGDYAPGPIWGSRKKKNYQALGGRAVREVRRRKGDYLLRPPGKKVKQKKQGIKSWVQL